MIRNDRLVHFVFDHVVIGVGLVLSVFGDGGERTRRLILPDIFQGRCHRSEIEIFVTRLLSMRSHFDRMIGMRFDQCFGGEQAEIEFQDVG